MHSSQPTAGMFLPWPSTTDGLRFCEIGSSWRSAFTRSPCRFAHELD